ncbi:MAG TPA: hypothetical protein PL192_06840 [Polynucleobacter sp.]|jgi:hypothetical protein|nr:hypothetical protein [Polynucleobacter sp.]
MKKLHKHAELIKAWADGAEIEYESHGIWVDEAYPDWYPEMQYRIKPEPKPDVVEDVFVWKSPLDGYPMMVRHDIPNLRLIFDRESGLFKDAEVLE